MAKNDFQYGGRRLEFKKSHIWSRKRSLAHVTVIELQICCCAPNFNEIG